MSLLPKHVFSSPATAHPYLGGFTAALSSPPMLLLASFRGAVDGCSFLPPISLWHHNQFINRTQEPLTCGWNHLGFFFLTLMEIKCAIKVEKPHGWLMSSLQGVKSIRKQCSSIPSSGTAASRDGGKRVLLQPAVPGGEDAEVFPFLNLGSKLPLPIATMKPQGFCILSSSVSSMASPAFLNQARGTTRVR